MFDCVYKRIKDWVNRRKKVNVCGVWMHVLIVSVAWTVPAYKYSQFNIPNVNVLINEFILLKKKKRWFKEASLHCRVLHSFWAHGSGAWTEELNILFSRQHLFPGQLLQISAFSKSMRKTSLESGLASLQSWPVSDTEFVRNYETSACVFSVPEQLLRIVATLESSKSISVFFMAL